MAEAASVTTVVVGDRLPWPDDPRSGDEKGPLDPGAIYHFGIRRDCTIRKISALGATLRSDIEPALGDRVAVELATGQRPQGRIAWTGKDEVGVRFDDCVDMIALLNRKLVSQTPDRRTMPRVEVRCPVYVKYGENFRLATLRNISARGLQIEGDELPIAGSYVAVFVEGLNIPAGEVIWRRDKLAGIEVFEELSWTSIIPWIRSLAKQG
jgi:hypothetical protein